MWILSLTYLILGFFNIMFAWLGLLCFFIPLIIALVQGNKGYCNRYCGRGQLFGLLGGRLGLSRKKDIPGCEGELISRLKFPTTEYSDNGENTQAAVSLLKGTDIAGTRLWWDVKR